MPDTKRVWIIGDGKPAFMFDAVLREAHRSHLETTDNPVETGVPITDHAFMAPLRLEIEAGVGDIWLGMRDASAVGRDIDAFAVEEAGQTTDDLAPLGPSNQDVAWLTQEGGGDDSTRCQRAYRQLKALQKSAVPFKVQTNLDLYPDMVIEDFDVEQDKDTGAVVYFKANLKQIIIVGTETVTFPPRKAGKTKRQGGKKADNGEKKAKTTPPSNISAALNSLLTPAQQAKLKADPAGLLIDLFTGGS
jgi:hypothetical protein